LKVSSDQTASTITAEPARTIVMGRSRSRRPPCVTTAARSWPGFVRMLLMPALSAPMMVGIVFKSVISPAAATAPAPM
jgi:hypothetical protein